MSDEQREQWWTVPAPVGGLQWWGARGPGEGGKVRLHFVLQQPHHQHQRGSHASRGAEERALHQPLALLEVSFLLNVPQVYAV